jgi:hypothetical protein
MNESVCFPRLTHRQVFDLMCAIEFYISKKQGCESFTNEDYARMKETESIIHCARFYTGTQESPQLIKEDVNVIEAALSLYMDYLHRIKSPLLPDANEIERRIPQILWKIRKLKGE